MTTMYWQDSCQWSRVSSTVPGILDKGLGLCLALPRLFIEQRVKFLRLRPGHAPHAYTLKDLVANIGPTFE